MNRTVWLLLACCAAGLATWVRAGTVSTSLRRRSLAPGPWRSRVTAMIEAAIGRRRQGAAASVTALLNALASELQAGQPPSLALASAASGLTPDPCPRARRALVVGASVPEALRADAGGGNRAGLVGLAACWQVAEESGAGLAVAVGRLAEGQRAAQDARDQLAAELAAVRGSARLLGTLPLLGLGLGHVVGAEPLRWLTGTWPGLGALLCGSALQVIGLAWLRRIVRAVERDW